MIYLVLAALYLGFGVLTAVYFHLLYGIDAKDFIQIVFTWPAVLLLT